jgi:hypothetical protein
MRLQSDCKAITKRLQSDCKANVKRYQSDWRAIGERLQYDYKAITKRLQSDYKAITKRLQSDCKAITSFVAFFGSMEVRTRNPGGPKLISERSESHRRESVFHIWGIRFASPEEPKETSKVRFRPQKSKTDPEGQKRTSGSHFRTSGDAKRISQI